MKGVLDRESRRSQRSAGGIDLRSSRQSACSRERAKRVEPTTGRQRSALDRVRIGGECPSARRDQSTEAGRASLNAEPAGVPQLAARFAGNHSEQGCSSLKCGLQKSTGRVSVRRGSLSKDAGTADQLWRSRGAIDVAPRSNSSKKARWGFLPCVDNRAKAPSCELCPQPPRTTAGALGSGSASS
jgi:hypothetical protein